MLKQSKDLIPTALSTHHFLPSGIFVLAVFCVTFVLRLFLVVSRDDEENIFPSEEDIERRKLRHEKEDFIKVCASILYSVFRNYLL